MVTEDRSSLNSMDYFALLEKVKEISKKLEETEKELKTFQVDKTVDDKRIEDMMLVIKELEVSNEFMKKFLYNSLKWTILIVSLTISILLTILGASISLIAKHLKLFF